MSQNARTSAAGSISKERRQRAFHQKVRTGCLTCRYAKPWTHPSFQGPFIEKPAIWLKLTASVRIRHKKCDEGRPACRLCTSTGRKCDGYEQNLDRRTRSAKNDEQAAASPFQHCTAEYRQDSQDQWANFVTEQHITSNSFRPLMSLVDASQVHLNMPERFLFNLFLRNTSRQCAGYFVDEFWQLLIPQASEIQPAVRHAVIGIGALHWWFQSKKSPRSADLFLDRSFHLRQCNKAIACLQQDLLAKSQPDIAHMENVLVTCVALIALALFQTNIRAAQSHMDSGFELLKQCQEKSDFCRSSTGSLLIRKFAQLKLHWLAFSNPETFVAINQIRPHQFNGRGTGHRSHDSYEIRPPRNEDGKLGLQPTEPSLEAEKDAVLSNFWDLKGQQNPNPTAYDAASQREYTTQTLLEIWNQVIYIKSASKGIDDNNEMAYDGLLDHFRHAVWLTKALLEFDSANSEPLMPTFSVRAGIIQPLFFCGFKCRDWSVRREALGLLRGHQRQEGIWRSHEAALVLKRLIDIESEGASVEGIEPELFRVNSVQIEVTDDSNVRFCYRKNHARQDGDYGELWHTELLSH